MTMLLELPDQLKNRRQFTFFDDFLAEDVKVGDGITDTIRWTITADAGGTQGLDVDGVGGLYSIATDGDDNDEAYIESRELFLPYADKPLIFEARVQFTEANTDDANIIVGLADAPGANSLQDNGATPAAINDSGALFYKVDGGTVWRVTSRCDAATQQDTATTTTAGGSSYQTLRIEMQPTSSTYFDVIFYVDGEQVKDSNGNLIKHTQAFGTPVEEMAIVLGAKAGGANAETLVVDYVMGTQLR